MYVKTHILAAIAAISSTAFAAPVTDADRHEFDIVSKTHSYKDQHLSHSYLTEKSSFAVPSVVGSSYTFNAATGTLTWTLLGGPSSNARLEYNATTDVAGLVFDQDSKGDVFTLDKDGYLLLEGLDRWWVCEVDLIYKRPAIQWLLGEGRPNQKDCTKISLKQNPVISTKPF